MANNKNANEIESKNQIRRREAVIMLLVLSALLVAIAGSMAAYTYQSYVKGVAATNASDVLFLSDNLRQCRIGTSSSDFPNQKMIVKVIEGQETVSISFYIRNYKGTQTNENQIQYTLKIKPSIDSNYILDSMSGGTGFVSSYSGSFTMDANTPAQHEFKITMPREAFNNNVSFTITAEPTDHEMTKGYMLAAVLQPTLRGSTAESISITGAFADKTSSNNPYDLDAFNYIVTVANAKEDVSVTLTWNSEYVEIDKFFAATDSWIENDDGTNSYTFKAGNGSYLVQFFRKKPKDSTNDWQKNWDGMKAVIRVAKSEN